jgi:hypothetical protein
MSQLDDIEKLLEAATPGPWKHRPGIDPPGDVIAPHLGEHGPRGFITQICGWGRAPDAALIAAAPDALRYLLRVARAAEGLLGELDPRGDQSTLVCGKGTDLACDALRAALEGRE